MLLRIEIILGVFREKIFRAASFKNGLYFRPDRRNHSKIRIKTFLSINMNECTDVGYHTISLINVEAGFSEKKR